MAQVFQDVLSGATLVADTNNFAAYLKNITLPEISVNDCETTHQASAAGTDFTQLTAGTGKKWRTYVPGDYLEPGEITADFYFDASLIPPVGKFNTANVLSIYTITWPSGGTWIFNGYMKTYGGDALEMDGVMMVKGIIKLSGPIEITT